MPAIAIAAPRKAAIVFILITVALDILALGMIIPVLPHLFEQFLGNDTATAVRFYGYAGSEGGSRWTGYPSVAWGDLSAPLLRAADGQLDESPAVAVMRVSPRAIRGLLFSGNAELRTSVWAALITVTALLFDIYLIALLMAGFMIFGLSRAVNRLYRATESVARGDFSVRIPVRRKDQIGRASCRERV